MYSNTRKTGENRRWPILQPESLTTAAKVVRLKKLEQVSATRIGIQRIIRTTSSFPARRFDEDEWRGDWSRQVASPCPFFFASPICGLLTSVLGLQRAHRFSFSTPTRSNMLGKKFIYSIGSDVFASENVKCDLDMESVQYYRRLSGVVATLKRIGTNFRLFDILLFADQCIDK